VRTRMILAAMTLLAGGVLIGWLAASGHVAEKLQAQDKAPLKAQAAVSSDGRSFLTG
jgi:hypothetical protein